MVKVHQHLLIKSMQKDFHKTKDNNL